MTHDEILNLLRKRIGAEAVSPNSFLDNQRVTVPVDQLYSALDCLKREAGFDLLSELSAADYLHYPGAKDRYGLWYVLVNTTTGRRLILKTWVNDPGSNDPGVNYPDDVHPKYRLPIVPSVHSLWKGSDWMEREVYDMYGIVFEGHPDLRRILMPDEFSAFPLRKDYPMRGHGERHNFPVITRADS